MVATGAANGEAWPSSFQMRGDSGSLALGNEATALLWLIRSRQRCPATSWRDGSHAAPTPALLQCSLQGPLCQSVSQRPVLTQDGPEMGVSDKPLPS